MKKFSLLIPSYKEKERLYNLLKIILKDRNANKIDKIFVISPDNDIILPNSKKIFLIKEKSRKGKYFAIKLGLKKIKTEWVILLSSDLKMRKNFLKFFTKHFNNPKIGMIIGRPIADKNSKIYPFSKIIWDLHHFLCLKEPKGTEICAFRKVFNNFPKVSADEVFIEYKIKKSGFSLVYEPNAYGYTKIPYTIINFFIQRKRCFLGHIFIREKYGFTTSSMKLEKIFYSLVTWIMNVKSLSELLKMFVILQLEVIARISAFFEYMLFKKREIMWKKI